MTSMLVLEGSLFVESTTTHPHNLRVDIALSVYGRAMEPVLQDGCGDLRVFFGKKIRLTVETIE